MGPADGGQCEWKAGHHSTTDCRLPYSLSVFRKALRVRPFADLQQADDFFDAPHVIRQARGHRWRHGSVRWMRAML